MKAIVLHEFGKPDEALSLVEEARTVSENGDEHWYEGEIWRIRGDAFDATGSNRIAETNYLRAIEVAHGQGSKSLELRAATRLARLWHSQGKTTEARDLLAPVYGWFTEGFDTADLKEAKALLDELG